MISKEWFNRASKLYKSPKCFDNETLLRWNVARVEFVLIVNLLKLLISPAVKTVHSGVRYIGNIHGK